MRKSNLKQVAALLVCGAFLFSSCIGSFALHGKLLNWNRNISTKFVNELVFLACNVVPVYGICYLADALVINSIEFMIMAAIDGVGLNNEQLQITISMSFVGSIPVWANN